MRERRYKVLKEFVKGKTPKETAETLNMPMKQVENDRLFITDGGLKNTPAEIVRLLNNSYYEIKHAELESEAEKYREDEDRKSYIAIQKVIGDNKSASLKLMGLMNDKLDVKVDPITVTNIDIDEKLAEEFGNWLATKKEEDKAE
jgi:hypothetical protein